MTNGHAIIRAATLALVLTSCGKDLEPAPSPVPPTDPQVDQFTEASDRMLAMSSPPGWVVSRWDDGRVEHTGDSLLWTGMAMGVLDCVRGAQPQAALQEMLDETGGKAYRHPSEKARAPSLDGHLGLYWGIAKRARRCPDARPALAEMVLALIPVNVPKPFDIVHQAVAAELGVNHIPTNAAALTDTVAAWTYGVVLTKAAGYRVHLSLLVLETLEATSTGLPASARSKFCAASRGAGMPTVDYWCGRGDLAAWANAFQYDAYEYAHQRAAWESPDGKPGLATPGLDLIVALRKLHEPLPFNLVSKGQ